MAQQRQSFGPGRVLAQVTLIVALPLLAGVVAGLVIDGISGTSPLFVLSGMAIGTLVTIVWLRSFITTNAARLRGRSGEDAEHGQQRQDTAERP
jgi:F0F1-type ATP synthase assembly protein I